MNNDDLNQIKVNVLSITKNISNMVNTISNLDKSLSMIDDIEQPEEFKEAAIAYSYAKDKFISYLLTVTDSLSLTLMDVIEYVQSSPKAKLWTPESVR